MREVVLVRPNDDRRDTPELDHLHGVLDALNQVASQHVKVYRTFVPKGDKGSYVFTTTSKDLHLALGTLSAEGRLHLASLLELEFEAGECQELLMFTEAERNRGAMLVTCQVDAVADWGWCFHISPAR